MVPETSQQSTSTTTTTTGRGQQQPAEKNFSSKKITADYNSNPASDFDKIVRNTDSADRAQQKNQQRDNGRDIEKENMKKTR